MATNHEELLTLKQAAELIGSKASTLRNAINRGELVSQKVGPYHLVTANTVTEWAKTKKFRPERQKKFGS